MCLGTMENVNKWLFGKFSWLFGKFSKCMGAACVTSLALGLLVDKSEKAAGGLKEETREFGVMKETHCWDDVVEVSN